MLFGLVLAVALVGLLGYSVYGGAQIALPHILIGLTIIGLAPLLAAALNRRIERPILALAQTAQAIAQGQTAAHAPVAGPREIAAWRRSST